MKIKELLSDPSKWTQFAFARDTNKKDIGLRVEEASCWCLSGAIMLCYPKSREALAVRNQLQDVIWDRWKKDLVNFNDTSDYVQVFDLVEELDI